MSFTTIALTGNKVLVEGTDVRGLSDSQVVDSTQWDRVKSNASYKTALSAIDDAIATLVAPITAAVDAANAIAKPATLDPLLYVVEQDAVEHVAGQQQMLTKLNSDSVILRAIEEGKADRLLWVQHQLVLSAAPVVTVVDAGGDAV